MIRTRCPVVTCPWFHDAAVTAPPPNRDPDVPPWCLLTWAVASPDYGRPLTDAQVVGAHVATHTPAERAGWMPSRAEVEKSRARLLVPAGAHPHPLEECTP